MPSTPAYQSPLPINPADYTPANPYVPPEEQYVMGDHPTHNPDGVTNSNHDYWPKTQEEKAERLLVEMVTIVDVPPEEPYPEGSPPGEMEAHELWRDIHPPQERVSAADWEEQHIRNLRAGGSARTETEDEDTRSPAEGRARGRQGKTG